MSQQVEINLATAAKVAEYFESTGMPGAAARVWQTVSTAAPFDRRARQRVSDLLFDLEQARYPMGTVERSRFLVTVISKGFPTNKLSDAYFANLDLLLASRAQRERPGTPVLSVGPGRCGSTTLAAAFRAVDDSCATHENHPFIYWEPQEEQLRFHFERLRKLTAHYAVVFDAAHWWLNVLERFLAEFPHGKVIGLERETEACVQSFLNIKGRGPGSVNHWAPANNGIWATNLWDPVYPSYPLPPDAQQNPEGAKAALVRRYVEEYGQALRSLAEKHPDRILLVRTELLNDPATSARLSEHVGFAVAVPQSVLNAGTVADGKQEHFVI